MFKSVHTLIFEFWKESLEKTGFSREIDRGSSLSNSLKYGIWCGPVSTAKLFNSTEYLASEVFGFPLIKLAVQFTRHSLIQFFG